jgi:hypothetical protein
LNHDGNLAGRARGVEARIAARNLGAESGMDEPRRLRYQYAMQPAFLAVVLALLACAPAFAAGVYWSDRGASQLKVMAFDGSNLRNVPLSGAVTSPGTNIRGLAVDTVSNRLFWADNGLDRLLRANLDGTASTILYTVAGGNSFPADVRLNLAGGHFYWCDQLRNRIQRSNLDGGGVIDVITNAAPTGPYFMDLDVAAGKIYWGDFDGGSIFRASLDGSARETLLTGNNKTRGVRVDVGGGMLYWINRDDAKVHRCPLSAFNGGTIALTNPVVQTLYSGLDTPHGLELDIPARKLYWADTGSNAGTGSGDKAVSRGDFDGTTPMEILGTGSEPWDVDLDRRCATYAEWRLRCFRKDAPAAQTDPPADPDGDGWVNAVEYALDSPPLHGGGAVLPKGFLTTGPITNAVYQAVTYRRRATATDLGYEVQVSTNLTQWSGSVADPRTAVIEVRSLGDGMEEVTARTLDPVDRLPAHYLRVNVVFTP